MQSHKVESDFKRKIVVNNNNKILKRNYRFSDKKIKLIKNNLKRQEKINYNE